MQMDLFNAPPAATLTPATIQKAPFTYFGGKSKIAGVVWQALGNPRNYVEPFAGSLAVLLARPPGTHTETVNDYSCNLVNAWRAIARDPEGLASILIEPVSEVDTEARHYALCRDELALRDLLGDPAYYDITRAAWWVKGASEWIGSGWCSAEGPWSWTPNGGWAKRNAGTGVNRQLPHLGNAGKGVNRQLTHLGDAGTGVKRKLPHLGDAGKGVNRQLPHLGDAGKGVNRQLPHLGDAGTGVYQQRVEWVQGWLCALRDRLCSVRISCGDWERVCSIGTLTNIGPAGVFLDPPYDGTEYVYGKNSLPVSKRVFDWCAANGGHAKLKVVLAGRGDEHDGLLALGWKKHIWSGPAGYSNTALRHGEALWLSPGCNPVE